MRSLSPWVAAVTVAAVVGLGLGLDAIESTSGSPDADPEPAPSPRSGVWVCPVGDSVQGRATELVAAVPPGADGPAHLAMSAVHAGRLTQVDDRETASGSAIRRSLPEGLAEPAAVVRWWETPAGVTRLWRLGRESGAAGPVAGPCQASPASRWVIPGLATAGGATARVVVANPFDTGASVQVSIAAPDGLREPRVLENVGVPARARVTVPINDHAPAESDLGVIVETRSGRVVVEGIQQLDAAIGGVDGASLAAATSEPGTRWTVPWYRTDEGRAGSWLWITNPSEETAVVTVTVHTPDGGVAPETLGETTVGPGEVRRVDLGGLVDAPATAVTVSGDNDVPIAVSAATRVDEGPDSRTGIAVQRGVPDPAGRWVVTTPLEQGRRAQLALVNPGGGPARVDVALWNGSELVRPGPLQGVAVPPGGVARVGLTEHATAPAVTAFVTAVRGSVIAGIWSARSQGDYGLVAHPGIPASAWAGTASVPPLGHAPGMTGGLDTGAGEDPTTAEDDEPGTPAPLPTTPTPDPAASATAPTTGAGGSG